MRAANTPWFTHLPSTAWRGEIGPATSLDAPDFHASSDVREPISLHQAVCRLSRPMPRPAVGCNSLSLHAWLMGDQLRCGIAARNRGVQSLVQAAITWDPWLHAVIARRNWPISFRPFSQLLTWPWKKPRQRQCRRKDLARTANLKSFVWKNKRWRPCGHCIF